MTVTDALGRIKAKLGKGLFPNAEPEVRDILQELHQSAYSSGHEDGYEQGFEEAQYSVGDWNKPYGY